MEKELIFEPYSQKGIALKNRMVMAPMTRSRADNEGNVATELIAEYYAQRASAGLIITEGTFVSEEAIGVINVPGIYTDEQINGWKLTTEAVHKKGGKNICPTLAHGCLFTSRPSSWQKTISTI